MWNFSAASVGLPAYVGLPCKAMARQAHVEPLRWLCWPATQASRKQMSSPDTHQYTNTQGPVPLKKKIGAEGPVAQRSGNEERHSATPMSSPDTGGPNPSTGYSKNNCLWRSLAAQLHSKVTWKKVPLEVLGGPCPVRKLRKKETHGHAFRWGQQAIVCAPATPQSRRLILLTSVTYVFYILGCLCAPSGFMFLNFMYAHLCTQKQ